MVVSEVHSEESLGAAGRELSAEFRLPLALGGSRVTAQAAAGHVSEPRRLCLSTRNVVHAQSVAHSARVPTVAQHTALRLGSLERRIEFRVLPGQRVAGRDEKDENGDVSRDHV
jgi:hypothetical protein